MSFKANDQTGGGDFIDIPALEANTYPARLVQIVSMGLQAQRPFQGQAKDPKISMYTAYELSHEFMMDENGQPDLTKPRWVGEDFPFYNLDSDRATSTLRYLAMDPQVACEGDWEKVLSWPCNLTLSKEPKKGKDGKFVNYITHVSGATNVPGYVQPELVNGTRIFDIAHPDMEVFKKLPSWLRKKLVANLEYNGSALQKAMGQTATTEQAAPQQASTAPPAPAAPKAPPAPPAPPSAG